MDAAAATAALAGLFATSFVIGLSGAVMPGTVLAVTILHSSRLGFKAGPLVILGHAILEGSLVVALVLGLGGVLNRPLVSGAIGGVGALILLWMAWGMLRSLPGLRLDLATAETAASGGLGSHAAPVRDGLLLSLANPYFLLWWATVGLGLITMTMQMGLGALGLLVFYAGHICADLSWYSLVSLVVTKGRRWLSDRMHRRVVGACALCLLGFGVYFGVFAWQQISGA
ncbi:MAG: LysE family transporter [Desulfarculus sp.]|nr:LysE family transporter [Desulfarculus sp.]